MRGRFRRLPTSATSLLASMVLATTVMSYAAPQQDGSATQQSGTAGLYVEVQLTKRMKASALKPGDIVEGRLARDVYSGDRDLFPAGSSIRLVVSSLEKRKRDPNDHWPGVIGLFSPRHTTYPVFRSGTVTRPDGKVELAVSLITVTRPVEVNAKATDKQSNHQKKGRRPRGDTLILEAVAPERLPALTIPDTSAASLSSVPVTLTAGTQANIVLLAPLSASKSHPGDSFHARLIEPVKNGSNVILPAGSVFDGRVVRSKPPRWLSRPGSLYLTFTELTLPGGARVPVAAQLTGATTDQRSHLRLNNEGELSGGHPGKAWMLINLGVTAGVAKETDDAFQLIAEALVSTATDASTAGTARIVAACASGIYMVTRHGRDVVLPRFTRLDVTFNRPLSVAQASATQDNPPVIEDAQQTGLFY